VTREDEEHLRILSILHYVYGGLAAVGGCFGLFYIFVGATFMSTATRGPGQAGPPPAAFGMVFVVLGAMISLIAWALAVCIVLTGKYLSERRNHLFCLIVSGIICLNVPLGTALGVFTIIVLVRPTVKAGFGQGQYADALPVPPPPPPTVLPPDGGGYYRPG
jgi:hypothetical protein